MKLIEKWKNRETKGKLHEENIWLCEENKRPKNNMDSNVCTVEKNAQRIYSSVEAKELSKLHSEHCKNLRNNNACFKPFNQIMCEHCYLYQLCKYLSEIKENCIEEKDKFKKEVKANGR